MLTLHNMAAASLSMAIGAALPSVAAANMVGSIAVLSTCLLGGFLLSRSQMPLAARALASISYVRSVGDEASERRAAAWGVGLRIDSEADCRRRPQAILA